MIGVEYYYLFSYKRYNYYVKYQNNKYYYFKRKDTQRSKFVRINIKEFIQTLRNYSIENEIKRDDN